jgi:hypothetical protein
MKGITKELLKIVKRDISHDLEIILNPNGLRVNFIYNPDHIFDPSYWEIVPIQYDIISGGCYIDHKDYVLKFHPTSSGMDTYEVSIVLEIMQCLESHGEEIYKYCKNCNAENRKFYKEIYKDDNEFESPLEAE